jgi:agmatine/peptidylarginine deiminase
MFAAMKSKPYFDERNRCERQKTKRNISRDEIVGGNTKEMVYEGGNIHRITQQ